MKKLGFAFAVLFATLLFQGFFQASVEAQLKAHRFKDVSLLARTAPQKIAAGESGKIQIGFLIDNPDLEIIDKTPVKIHLTLQGRLKEPASESKKLAFEHNPLTKKQKTQDGHLETIVKVTDGLEPGTYLYDVKADFYVCSKSKNWCKRAKANLENQEIKVAQK